ncbi:MAG: hypothetical protein H6631_08980 [Anaerolineaceae bacterium]|nr:hypothetical protein [Anaerolineaceae bacterium]
MTFLLQESLAAPQGRLHDFRSFLTKPGNGRSAGSSTLASAYPTSLWDEGRSWDELAIPVDNVEPGRCNLAIGLYDFATGSCVYRLKVRQMACLLKNIQIPPDLE